MNEIIFFLQLALILAALLLALRFGRGALLTYIVLSCVLANLFVVKQITLFNLTVTASDAFAVGSFFALNLAQEFFGKPFAEKCAYTTFGFMFFYMAATLVHLWYRPDAADMTHPAFLQIMNITPRLSIVSLSVFLFSQRLDIALFSFLRKRLSLYASQNISLCVSQLFDTVLFSFGALYGVVFKVFDVILFSWLIKLLAVFTISLAMRLSKKFVGEQVYDRL